MTQPKRLILVRNVQTSILNNVNAGGAEFLAQSMSKPQTSQNE